jgi:hypothetical protein
METEEANKKKERKNINAQKIFRKLQKVIENDNPIGKIETIKTLMNYLEKKNKIDY